MNDRLSRVYLLVVNGLVLAALVWPLLPMSPGLNPQDTCRLLGFIVLGVAFALSGIFGFFLCYHRQMIFEVAIMVTLTPFFHLVALMAEKEYSVVSYFFTFPFIIAFSFVYWKRL